MAVFPFFLGSLNMTDYQQNPSIRDFCYQLLTRKMDVSNLAPEKIEALVDSIYTRVESKLGRNIVEFLPKEVREEIEKKIKGFELTKDSGAVDKMAALLSSTTLREEDFQKILNFTLEEVTDEFMNSG